MAQIHRAQFKGLPKGCNALSESLHFEGLGGAFEMRDESKANFVIIRNKSESGELGRVVEIVRGPAAAEHAVERHDRRLTQQESDEGWGHFLERTTLNLGTDPKLATQIRTMESESRRARTRRRRRNPVKADHLC